MMSWLWLSYLSIIDDGPILSISASSPLSKMWELATALFYNNLAPSILLSCWISCFGGSLSPLLGNSGAVYV
jgi:hypothetical protein